jgi:hypothetical protein
MSLVLPLSMHLSVRMKQLENQRTDFHEFFNRKFYETLCRHFSVHLGQTVLNIALHNNINTLLTFRALMNSSL